MSKAQTFDDWFESLQPKPTEAGHMGNLARGEWGQAKARAEKVWNAALASTTTDAVPKGVVAWEIVYGDGNRELTYYKDEFVEKLDKANLLYEAIPLGVLPFDGVELRELRVNLWDAAEAAYKALYAVTGFSMSMSKGNGEEWIGTQGPGAHAILKDLREVIPQLHAALHGLPRTALSHPPPATPRKGEGE